MNTQTITTQVNALINSIEFRQHCANVAKETGITPKEWNENKGMIIHSWAIEVVCNTKSK